MLVDMAAIMAQFFIFFIFYFVVFILVLIFALVIGGAPIALQNKATGHTKVLRPRFSFTYYFFGFWTPLIRGHWVSFFIALVIDIFTFAIGRLIYAFFINKAYIKHLQENGYEVINNFGASSNFNGGQTVYTQDANVVSDVEDTNN
ncbi:MAG: hypothetical protein ACK5LY_03285 [Lachnospirales bacterium]